MNKNVLHLCVGYRYGLEFTLCDHHFRAVSTSYNRTYQNVPKINDRLFFYTSYNVLIITNLIDIFTFSNPPNLSDRTLAFVHT